jgi:Family of unknown function (DUF5677)
VGLVSTPIDKKAKWLRYCRQLYDAGLRIIAESDFMTIGSDMKDPKALALALVCRTLSNFNGAVLMIEAGLIVEARTLTRSCFENLLWLAELVDRRDEFVAEMVRDEVASQQGRGKIALSWAERLEGDTDYKQPLRKRLDDLAAKYPRAKAIRFGDLGKGNNVNDSYAWFKILSADAAHPSLASLSRYFSKQPNDVLMLSLIPDPGPNENEQTLQFASQALLGVCVAACEICKVPAAHAALGSLFDQFIELASKP